MYRSDPRMPAADTRNALLPATSMPHWFADADQRGIKPYWGAGSFASSYNRLPNLRPDGRADTAPSVRDQTATSWISRKNA